VRWFGEESLLFPEDVAAGWSLLRVLGLALELTLAQGAIAGSQSLGATPTVQETVALVGRLVEEVSWESRPTLPWVGHHTAHVVTLPFGLGGVLARDMDRGRGRDKGWFRGRDRRLWGHGSGWNGVMLNGASRLSRPRLSRPRLLVNTPWLSWPRLLSRPECLRRNSLVSRRLETLVRPSCLSLLWLAAVHHTRHHTRVTLRSPDSWDGVWHQEAWGWDSGRGLDGRDGNQWLQQDSRLASDHHL